MKENFFFYMAIILFHASLVFNNISHSYECSTLKCDNRDDLFNLYSKNKYCIKAVLTENPNIINYKINMMCPNSSVCPAYFSKENVECTERVERNKVDGETCEMSSHCASNKCINRKCMGLGIMSPCNINEECERGLYCGKQEGKINNIKNCLNQKKEGEKCESEYECGINKGCHTKLKKCVTYFSLPEGENVDDKDYRLCKSMKVFKGKCVITLLRQYTSECLPYIDQDIRKQIYPSDCEYTLLSGSFDFETYYAPCKCSKSYSNRNFCELATMDPLWQKLIKNLKKHYNGQEIFAQSHTSMRHNYSYNQKLNKLYYSVYHYPEFKDVDECVLKLFSKSTHLKLSFYKYVIIILLYLLEYNY